VLLDSSDGQESWGSIGVSANVIEASWEALVDSLEYAFQQQAASSRQQAASPHGEGGTSELPSPA
jgi:2-isopropylmalate synthase